MMLRADFRPAYIDQALWDDLPAAQKLRWQRQEQRRQWFFRWATRLLLLPPLLYITVPPVQWGLNAVLPGPQHQIRFWGDADPLTGLDTTTLSDNDPITGTDYTVTSPFGWRIHPVHGDHRIHLGVDVNTPIGTSLYAPAVNSDSVTVSCWWDNQGGGNVAEISSQSVPDYRFKALHLQTCKSGVYGKGDVFATTGDTGSGTGPHLDFRQLPHDSGAAIAPFAGYVAWVLTGLPGQTAPENLRTRIKRDEGYSATAYHDPGYGIPTIGYGATRYPDGRAVKMGDTISQKDAETLLDWHITKAAQDVDNAVTVPLNRNEKEALTDLSYNIGGDQLKNSTLIDCLNQGDRQCAADEFLAWDKSDGKVLPGLVKRRKENKTLFLKPP